MKHIPTYAELSLIEQIEETSNDDDLTASVRRQRMVDLWNLLEEAHGGAVDYVMSPEGDIYSSPFKAQYE